MHRSHTLDALTTFHGPVTLTAVAEARQVIGDITGEVPVVDLTQLPPEVTATPSTLATVANTQPRLRTIGLAVGYVAGHGHVEQTAGFGKRTASRVERFLAGVVDWRLLRDAECAGIVASVAQAGFVEAVPAPTQQLPEQIHFTPFDSSQEIGTSL